MAYSVQPHKVERAEAAKEIAAPSSGLANKMRCDVTQSKDVRMVIAKIVHLLKHLTVAVLAFGVVIAALMLSADGQNRCTDVQGQNVVYGNCNNGALSPTGPPAFIDASVFGRQGSDICTTLRGIIAAMSAPAVIDARGLPSVPGESMTCNGTPWSGISNPPASTILLPAGTIISPGIWILPPGTHLIGEGDSIGSGTTIQAGSTFSATAGPIIQFCSLPCSDVSLERVNLDGFGGPINGIVNSFAGEGSFVDHLGLYQVRRSGDFVFSTLKLIRL